MRRSVALVTGAAALGLSACVTVPDSPTVRVLPPPNKPFEIFLSEDHLCRDFARNSVSASAEQANNSAVGTAAVGTAVGAAAGALLGGHNGAGAGAGMGLIMGSAVGSGQSARSNYSIQRRYDIAYEQCMYSKGNLLPGQSYAGGSPPPPPPPSTMTPPPPPPPAH
jgi:hypothetical protein